ncbi:MAG: thiamine diphosphokinase [Turicibacter sp.]|nr:thiamine diphosphokinase [Turicibacter sp.]
MNGSAHIVCGSPQLWLPRVKQLAGYLIGVDQGALKLIKKGIALDVAIGDFDSVSALERQRIEEKAKLVLELPAAKDMTDCEAAVAHAVALGYREIYIYGATGGRFDHQFATIGLMLKYTKQGIKIRSVDRKNEISILGPGEHLIPARNKRYVSFFALEAMVTSLTLENVKYPLKGYDLAVEDSLCVSNEPLAAMFGVTFDSGYLLMIKSSD